MHLRSALALAFILTLTGVCVLLYPRNPTAITTGIIFAVLGAIAARLFPVTQKSLGTGNTNAAPTLSTAFPKEQSRASLSPSTHEVAGDVPAVTLLEATMDSIREGVLVVDNMMRVVASNPAARDLFSSGDSALVARRLTEVTRTPAIHAAFNAALERGERAEVKVETQAGERRVFDLQVAPLRQAQAQSGSGGAEVRGAVGVFFDITRLEKLERVRQEFLSNVSHELRTPLTAIITFVETLEDGAIDDPENNRRFLTVIRRNSERMHTLIDDILELSAIEAGTVAVEVGPVRLHSLVNECVTSLAAAAAEQRVALFNDTVADAVIYADARRLEQMLTNLVHNAIKFNREGGEVRVGHERAGARDRIAVSDTGEGIAPEHIERIFERFYRVDRARSRALGGTGLGLAIVKHLARAHGGETTVRSTPNQGSTFTIELPSLGTGDK
ncbi:MAG TPA: ATP-binding protein [Pyrinomonadaceae bacterium]|nr:ATP-binding protein [Pyrinomonadaceae bacterium]